MNYPVYQASKLRFQAWIHLWSLEWSATLQFRKFPHVSYMVGEVKNYTVCERAKILNNKCGKGGHFFNFSEFYTKRLEM